MAKKIKVEDFRAIVRKMIKEERENAKKAPIQESVIREIIKEEMEGMSEAGEMLSEGGIFGQINKTMPVGDTFTVSKNFEGDIDTSQSGSRGVFELQLWSPDIDLSNDALGKVISNLVDKQISLTSDALVIPDHFQSGLASIVKPEQHKRFMAMLQQAQESGDDKRAQMLNKYRELYKKNIRVAIGGVIRLPKGTQVSKG